MYKYMYANIYIYMYIHRYVHVHIYMIYTYIYIYIYIYKNISIYIHIYIYIYIYVCVYIYKYTHVYICIYTHVCIYVYMYTYMFMYIYIYVYIWICTYVHVYIFACWLTIQCCSQIIYVRLLCRNVGLYWRINLSGRANWALSNSFHSQDELRRALLRKHRDLLQNKPVGESDQSPWQYVWYATAPWCPWSAALDSAKSTIFSYSWQQCACILIYINTNLGCPSSDSDSAELPYFL